MQGTPSTLEELATDMLHMHNSVLVQPMLDAMSADSQLLLEDLHAQCVSCFASWFKQIVEDHPVSSLLALTSRAASDTATEDNLPADLTTIEQRTEQAHKLLEFAGRKVDQPNGQLPDKWFALVACGSSVLNSLSRVSDTHRQDMQSRLLTRMQTTLRENLFLNELVRDSCRSTSAEKAYMDQLASQLCTSQAVPRRCWRLIAISQQNDIWLLDIQHWRLSLYSRIAGPIHVKGKLPGGNSQSTLSNSWQEPGFHFKVGALPVPLDFSQSSSNCKVFLLEPSGAILSSSLLNPTLLPPLDTIAQSLATLGLEHAELDVAAIGARHSTD